MRVILTLHAVGDIEEACDYYSEIDQNLSVRFADDVDAAIERIMMFPAGAPPVEGFDTLRRSRMRRFPYGIFYQQTSTDELLIVRVLHSGRDHPNVFGGQ